MGHKINIVIDQGSSFLAVYNFYSNAAGAPIDMSVYGAISSMRMSYYSANSYLLNANTYSNGSVVLSLNAVATTSITPGRYVYDVDIVDKDNNVSRLIEGVVTVTPGVTYGNNNAYVNSSPAYPTPNTSSDNISIFALANNNYIPTIYI
jgi:hypothetical protein